MGQNVSERNPKFHRYLRVLIAALMALGRDDEAHNAGNCLLRLNPRFQPAQLWINIATVWDEFIRVRFMDYLTRAGLPA